MKKLGLLSVFVLALLFSSRFVCAQVLDDEDSFSDNNNGELSFDKTDDNEVLFNEMFSEYSETERDITKVNSFEDAADVAAGIIKESGVLQNETVENPVVKVPLEGDMLIGVSNGSFKIFQTMSGRMNCSFSVTLKSNLNKDIRLMGLSLIYPHGAFAFVFRDIPAHKSQVRYITTGGDICYNLAGAPDIDINLCKIKGAASNECALRLKWDDKIQKPEEEN